MSCAPAHSLSRTLLHSLVTHHTAPHRAAPQAHSLNTSIANLISSRMSQFSSVSRAMSGPAADAAAAVTAVDALMATDGAAAAAAAGSNPQQPLLLMSSSDAAAGAKGEAATAATAAGATPSLHLPGAVPPSATSGPGSAANSARSSLNGSPRLPPKGTAMGADAGMGGGGGGGGGRPSADGALPPGVPLGRALVPNGSARVSLEVMRPPPLPLAAVGLGAGESRRASGDAARPTPSLSGAAGATGGAGGSGRRSVDAPRPPAPQPPPHGRPPGQRLQHGSARPSGEADLAAPSPSVDSASAAATPAPAAPVVAVATAAAAQDRHHQSDTAHREPAVGGACARSEPSLPASGPPSKKVLGTGAQEHEQPLAAVDSACGSGSGGSAAVSRRESHSSMLSGPEASLGVYLNPSAGTLAAAAGAAAGGGAPGPAKRASRIPATAVVAEEEGEEDEEADGPRTFAQRRSGAAAAQADAEASSALHRGPGPVAEGVGAHESLPSVESPRGSRPPGTVVAAPGSRSPRASAPASPRRSEPGQPPRPSDTGSAAGFVPHPLHPNPNYRPSLPSPRVSAAGVAAAPGGSSNEHAHAHTHQSHQGSHQHQSHDGSHHAHHHEHHASHQHGSHEHPGSRTDSRDPRQHSHSHGGNPPDSRQHSHQPHGHGPHARSNQVLPLPLPLGGHYPPGSKPPVLRGSMGGNNGSFVRPFGGMGVGVGGSMLGGSMLGGSMIGGSMLGGDPQVSRVR